MESFIDFVTDISIIECICKKRASEAAKRHEAHHCHVLSPGYKVKEPNSLVYQLTPPRRQWIQLGDKGRRIILPGGVKQTISTVDRTYYSVLWTILRDLRNHTDKPYLLKLKEFVQGIKDRIIDPSYAIQPPKTIPILKKRKIDAPDEYRPICLFEDLYDAVIIILANRYLSCLFDGYFYEDSLAFRPKRLFHGKSTITFHHEAITLIEDYLTRIKNRTVYVAECDMQKFYDTVDHEIVKKEYTRLIELAKNDNPGISFDEITHVFLSFLDCYTFTDNVWKQSQKPEYWKEYNIENGVFGWVKEYQQKTESARAKKPIVGVPQGGALSGLIANIVINRVDSSMVLQLHKSNDLYIRYCDDMLLLSTNQKRCCHLFRLYMDEIRNAKLVPHCAETVSFGQSDYWKAKTKSVYKWVSDDVTAGSRWIGFVGYEINRNGNVRIRKSSIKKEKRKQRKVVNDLFALTYKKRRVNDASMESSYRSTLTSMAVGRATLWNFKTLKNEFCWINGFRKLNDNKTVKTQIRDLDRCRNRVIHRANKRLDRLQSKVGGKIAKEGNNKQKKGANQQELGLYYGKPFSYYYHYMKNIR